MSGIYIKDMEMPKERERFQITIKYNGLVFDAESGIQIAEAHEVPDHGDLIDRDEIERKLCYGCDACNGDTSACAEYRLIVTAQTIIPADRSDKEEDG